MIADRLLSRIENVRQTGPDRWIARCPAHNDGRASLSVRESANDKSEIVLVHCFAGCDVESILCAAGLTFSDLYPERPLDHKTTPQRRPFNAYDVLQCCAQEITIAAVITVDILGGKAISGTDRERLWKAAERLASAAEVAHGKF